MRRNSLACLFLFLIVSHCGASSTSGRDNLFQEDDLVSSSNSNESPLPVIPTIDYTYTTRSCLYVSPDLPPCRFNRDDNSQRFHRSLDESNEGVKLKRKFPFEDLATVYALQGCLPSRLPFKMTLCESKDSLERATRIWKLYPFQGTEEERRNSFVFPRFDLERWTREMELLKEEERGRRNEAKTVGKNDPEDSFLPSREYFPATISTSLDQKEKEGSAVSRVVRNHSRESETNGRNERRRRRRDGGRKLRRNERQEGERSSRDRREIRKVEEFPYSRSILFDPTTLGHDERSTSKFLRPNLRSLLSRRSRDIKLGSEFPYWKAIPYDSKKHKFYGIISGDHRAQKLQF